MCGVPVVHVYSNVTFGEEVMFDFKEDNHRRFLFILLPCIKRKPAGSIHNFYSSSIFNQVKGLKNVC